MLCFSSAGEEEKCVWGGGGFQVHRGLAREGLGENMLSLSPLELSGDFKQMHNSDELSALYRSYSSRPWVSLH